MKYIKEEGQSIPFGYAPTRVLWERYNAVEFYPFGIHWIMKLYYRFIDKQSSIFGDMKKAYDKGYEQANKDFNWWYEPIDEN